MADICLGEFMSLLFLSTKDFIHGQSEKLLVSLKQKNVSFCFACPENSSNAGFASARAFDFLELPKNGVMRFFALKKYISLHKIVHIHVFDQKALRLALWLKKIFPYLKIAGEWHGRVLNGSQQNIKKDNPYLYALTKGKFGTFFCSSPELAHYLGRTYRLQSRIGVLPYVSDFGNTVSSLEKESLPFVFFLHSYCENEADLAIALEAMGQLVRETRPPAALDGRKARVLFFVCLENTQYVSRVLELAEQHGVLDCLVCTDTGFFETFYPLCDSVLCVSSDGEGDYPMIHRAWHDGKVLVASDLAVHTKFILSDSMDCALLYPRDDAASLCKCMHKVLQDGGLRRQLVLGGKNKAGRDLLGVMAAEYLKKLS